MKPTYYKLTDQNGQTKNNTQWGENVTHKATGTSVKLCSNGWIHFYCDPVLAVLMNPIHALFKQPKLWEGFASGEELHEPLKSGSREFTTTKQITLPKITPTQTVIFGILCAKEVCHEPSFNVWADNYISGKNRSQEAAAAAYSYAAASSYADAASYAGAADAASYAAASAAASSYADASVTFVALAHKALTYV